MTHRPKHDRPSESGTFRISPRFLFAILLIALVAAFGLAVRYLPDLNWIVERENLLRSWIATAPVISCAFGFILYVALSLIPGTAGKSIVFGWLFGFLAALVIVEIGLTTAAIVSFLLGRFIVKHILERRWQSHLKWFSDRFEHDGAFYLLWLRMAHAPFTVVNYGAGATNIPLGTFWWTTHVGILPATLVFTFAGSRIPNIGTVAEKGVWAIVDPPLLVILTVTAFLPIVLRPWLRKSLQSNQVTALPSWNASMGAGIAYFAIVFTIGFALGMIRVPFLAPLLGDLTAVLLELPIILTLAWLVCRKLVSSWKVPPTIGSRAVMGGIAFLMLLVAELAFSTIVFGNSIVDHLGSYSSLPNALGLVGQVAFGVFPVIQIGLSANADVGQPSELDAFIAHPDVQEQFSIIVRAPASIVYEVATEFDMQSFVLVRTIFWLREKLLGSTPSARPAQGLIADMRSLGWGCLMEREGEIFVAGAACQPWQADVVFTPIPSDLFSSFSEPSNVKIAWTIATYEKSPLNTELSTETRAIATDAATRSRFLRYWSWARFGIIPIRWILLPAIRRESERRWRMESDLLPPTNK